jgi:hypothetical protein
MVSVTYYYKNKPQGTDFTVFKVPWYIMAEYSRKIQNTASNIRMSKI